MQYVIMKEYETNKIDLIGRFKSKGIGEIWQNGEWLPYFNLISDLLDGLLENVTEVEAKRLISMKIEPALNSLHTDARFQDLLR